MRTTGISTADLPRGFGEQILVVDDEPNLGESLGERLRSYGYRTMVFTSSREALELFENKPDEFVLTITDQTMPELTGVELVRAMRRVRPDMPAILNSGFSDQIDADGAAGMSVCYLGKPGQHGKPNSGGRWALEAGQATDRVAAHGSPSPAFFSAPTSLPAQR